MTQYVGALKSGKMQGLPTQTGIPLSIRFIAFEADGEPIVDAEGRPGELLLEFNIEATGVLLHKNVVSRANVKLGENHFRTLVFGKYPSFITVAGDRNENFLTNASLLKVEDPTLTNAIPHILKAELAIRNRR